MLATYCFVELASGVLGMGDATEAHKELLQVVVASKNYAFVLKSCYRTSLPRSKTWRVKESI